MTGLINKAASRDHTVDVYTKSSYTMNHMQGGIAFYRLHLQDVTLRYLLSMY